MPIPRETPIGTPVLADVAEYPSGYAQGETPTGATVVGTLDSVEGDAGIAWCFVKVADPDNRPEGRGEYMHVPMDRVQTIAARLEELRAQIDAECISYGEIAELQGLAKYIDMGDPQLLEWAGVPEEVYRAQFDARTLDPGDPADAAKLTELAREAERHPSAGTRHTFVVDCLTNRRGETTVIAAEIDVADPMVAFPSLSDAPSFQTGIGAHPAELAQHALSEIMPERWQEEE